MQGKQLKHTMKTGFLFCFFFVCIFDKSVQAQDFYTCDKDEAKIYFTGKAPSPWAIDGKIKDWESIFGRFTGNDSMPFKPPASSGFNWARDGWFHGGYWGLQESDHPSPSADLIFDALTNDDYNVYFYFRRLYTDDSIRSFFYFCDINLDGFMNYGEPVLYGSFNRHKVLSFSIGMFIPDSSLKKDSSNPHVIPYIPNKGNDMAKGWTLTGYRMPGSIKKIFDSKNIPEKYKLKKNEVFAAKMTEKGYGIEFAVPWKYFRYLNNDSSIFKQNDAFAYRIAIQNGNDSYNPLLVEDDAFSCSNSLPVSDNGKVEKKISIIKIDSGLKYRFNIDYSNPTNGDEVVAIHNVSISGAKINQAELPKKDLTFSIWPDSNCTSTPDSNNLSYTPKSTFTPNDYGDTNTIDFDLGDSGPGFIIPAHKHKCFVAYLSVPPSLSISNCAVNFETSVIYLLHSINDPLYGGGYPEDHSGDVSIKIENNKSNSEVATFPWPPPQASTETILNNKYFKKAATLNQVKTILDTALYLAGYKDKSYYLVPNGFVIVTRIEQIKPDGFPLSGINRWSTKTNQDYLSFIEKFNAEFNLIPGYFRVFAFIVTDKSFFNNSSPISREAATKWSNGGYNKLPDFMGDLKFSKNYNCTVLIYEYQQPQVDAATLMQPSSVAAEDHLVNSGVLINLEKK